MTDTEKDSTEKLMRDFFVACMETAKYHTSTTKFIRMQAKARKLFARMEGRKPTDEEIERITTY